MGWTLWRIRSGGFRIQRLPAARSFLRFTDQYGVGSRGARPECRSALSAGSRDCVEADSEETVPGATNLPVAGETISTSAASVRMMRD